RRMEEIASKQPFQPGGHHPEGMFLAKGPNVQPGAVRGELADVTPTVLALLGVPIPGGLDGDPLDVLAGVRAELSTEAAVVEVVGRGTNASGYTAEEEEAVRRRLEDL